jgi:hypothetical protein
MATINISTGESKTESSKSYYTDFDDPSRLPGPALCDRTIDEWAAYKRWEIDQIAAAAKAKLRKNDPLYDYRHSLVPKRPIECPE